MFQSPVETVCNVYQNPRSSYCLTQVLTTVCPCDKQWLNGTSHMDAIETMKPCYVSEEKWAMLISSEGKTGWYCAKSCVIASTSGTYSISSNRCRPWLVATLKERPHNLEALNKTNASNSSHGYYTSLACDQTMPSKKLLLLYIDRSRDITS